MPAGADETVTEAGGAALVVGSGTRAAAGELDSGRRVWLLERAPVTLGALAAALAPVLSAWILRRCPRHRTAVISPPGWPWPWAARCSRERSGARPMRLS